MAIEDLMAVLSPPSQPVFTGSVAAWQTVEHDLGLTLPSDLHDMCVRYGSGQVVGITIYNPFSPHYQQVVRNMLTIFRGLRDDLGQAAVPFLLFPERSGLFPVGKEDHGGTLFWLTDGEPDQWPLVLTDTTFKYEQLKMSLTMFLSKLVKKQIDCLLWDRSELVKCYPEIRFLPFSACDRSDG